MSNKNEIKSELKKDWEEIKDLIEGKSSYSNNFGQKYDDNEFEGLFEDLSVFERIES